MPQHIRNPLVDYPVTDPSARVFQGRLYVYGGSDAFMDPLLVAKKNLDPALHMQDYRVFSTDDMVDWTDHGEICHVRDVPWAVSHLWAPDCIENNGKYYFYFPGNSGVELFPGYGRIGVAVADHPAGPFRFEREPIEGVIGGEPCLFREDNGETWMFYKAAYPGYRYGQDDSYVYAVKLDDSMLKIASTPQRVFITDELPEAMYWEGPWVHKYQGRYYLSYPGTPNNHFGPQHMAYAISDSLLGPYKSHGVIMAHDPANVDDTNHGSIVQFRDRWYLFYHHRSLPWNVPGSGRKMCAQELFYNADGTIQPIGPTPLATP